MEYITLKNSDLRVSRLCMGGCPMGGYGWGSVSDANLVDAVHTALAHGVTFFDTADTYGLGKSEELLGKALKGNREKAIIATKFGVRVENGLTFYDNSTAWINAAVEASLRRLGTDYIDLYQIHYRDGATDMADIVDALDGLQQKGYIRYYGLSNIQAGDLDELAFHAGKFVSFQNEYSLARRDSEGALMHLANELQLTPLTWGSLGQGILTGKYDTNSVFGPDDRRSRETYVNFHGDKLRKNLKIVKVMRAISEQNGRSIPAIAIRFILDHISGSVVLAGVKNSKQLLSNVESMGWRLSEEHLASLLDVSENEV